MAEDEKYELRSNPGRFQDVSYAIPKEGDAWSEDYFYKTFSDASGLAELDVSTIDGSNKFYGIVTDPSVKKWNSKTLSTAHKNLTQIVQAGLAENSIKNIKGLAGILDDQTAFGVDLSFPGFYTSDSSKSYVSVTSAINHAQDVVSDVKNDAKAYLEKRFEGLSDTSKGFWATMSREILEADQKISQREAFDILQKYGSAQKYLAKNITTGNKLAIEFEKKQAEFQKEVQEALQIRYQENGGYLTAQEEMEFQKGFEAKQKELLDRYKQGARASKVIPELLRTVMQEAYETLDAKKKSDESKKDSDKSKKK